MLPRRLAEGDLSLLPGRPRPAVTFAIALSTDFQITSLDIFRSLLENRGRLSYAQADRVIAGSADSPCRGPLLACHELAGRLIARRRDAGALAIYDLRRGWRTTEDGTLVPLTAANSHRSNILVQEAMILANTALAAHAVRVGLPILYRNHAASPGDPDRDTALARIQDAVAGRDGGLLAALRGSQPVVHGRARYAAAPEGHHALNLPCYAHWTSPIRRYADLLNHQVLAAHLDGESPPHDVMALAEIAGRIHEVTDAIRDARIARMKDDHKREMETLAAGDAPVLASLAPDDFFKALGLALAGGLLTPLLVDELAALRPWRPPGAGRSHCSCWPRPGRKEGNRPCWIAPWASRWPSWPNAAPSTPSACSTPLPRWAASGRRPSRSRGPPPFSAASPGSKCPARASAGRARAPPGPRRAPGRWPPSGSWPPLPGGARTPSRHRPPWRGARSLPRDSRRQSRGGIPWGRSTSGPWLAGSPRPPTSSPRWGLPTPRSFAAWSEGSAGKPSAPAPPSRPPRPRPPDPFKPRLPARDREKGLLAHPELLRHRRGRVHAGVGKRLGAIDSLPVLMSLLDGKQLIRQPEV